MEHDVCVQPDALGDWYWHCSTCVVGSELFDTQAEAEADADKRNHIEAYTCGHFHQEGSNHPLSPCGDYRCCIN
jgi:hypothetical protein